MTRIQATLLILIAAVLISDPVLAQQKERETKQTVAMSQSVFEDLTEAQTLIEAKDYTGGQGLLSKLAANEKLTPYERAQVHNLSGYSYYLQERFQDAIRAYERVMAQPELPEALQQSTLKTMAQLQFTIEDYPTALETIKRLMAVVTEPSADVYMLLGQAYFQMQDYQAALDPIRTAIDMTRDQGRVPRENDLLLLRVCYYELGNFPAMIDVLIELVTHYPKDTYILTLAGVYSELGDTKKQLALAEVLYERGYLNNPTHITNLANLYLLHETPYKAAVLLEKEMEADRVPSDERNLRLLSQAWYTAREDEKAIPPLKRAAEQSQEGELFVRLAQAHINLEQFSEAVEALNKGLQLGGLSREDTANIMLGMAHFNLKQLNQAKRAFERALPDNRSRRAASQWIQYVESELRRQELMDQELPEMAPRQIEDILQSNADG
ncbi:MAG: tetratricopeptide repeat protein [Xanthomonadales bacterium]|nr:tetratricopeptide repeat protein [Xanthomonadales bacterium]